MVRSPGQVTALLAARADFVGKGVPALNGAASRANPETVRALLKCRCDPDFPGGRNGFVFGMILYYNIIYGVI